MAPGWTWKAMAGAGGRAWWFTTPAGSRIAITDIGFIPTAAGIGFRIIRGAGRRSITAAGFSIRAWAGAGSPDTVWGPSWVTWRYSNDYCGWAPLPPFAVYRAGVGFFYQGSGVSIGFDFGLGVNCFTFVPTRNFCDPHPRRYRVAARDDDADLQPDHGHQQLQF